MHPFCGSQSSWHKQHGRGLGQGGGSAQKVREVFIGFLGNIIFDFSFSFLHRLHQKKGLHNKQGRLLNILNHLSHIMLYRPIF
jgi:hypothetical protein